MGFTKNKAWSIVIALIALILLNVVAFVLPVEHNVLFWLGYSFAIFANLLLVSTAIITLNKPNINETFLGLPALSVAWIYFSVQTVFSIWQMAYLDFPYFVGVIINSILAVFTVIVLILASMATKEIKEIDEKIAEKVFYIRNLKAELELLNTDDSKLASQIKDLRDTVRFSDPMSHSQLAPIENKIENKFNILKENIDNVSIATTICDELQSLLAERNKKCRVLKGVPETKVEKDDSGINILAITFAVLSVLAIFLLVLIFVIVPSSKYNSAMNLYDAEHYEEAMYAFEDLGKYKDSKLMVEEIKEKIFDEQYLLAEKLYKNQQYVEAIKIYEELGDYKESKDKIEHIYNMFATGGKIYFGVYEDKPIPWKILHTDKEKMLLITEYPVEVLAYHNELKNITWETSSIRQWLNDDFLNEFSDEQKNRLLVSVAKDINDNVFLLSQEEFEQYSSAATTGNVSDWWLRTKTDAGMMFVNGETGEINTYGNGVVHALGVRPCVWVSLY